MDAVELPPTPDPYVSPPQVVIVVGWLLVSAFVVATGVRLGTKVSMKRLLGVDDGLIVLAMVLGIGQMVATFVQARLAKVEMPTGEDWISFQQAFYASQLLFVPTICIAKLSVLHSLHQITPVREHKAPIIAFAVIVSVILLAFEFATGFQCGTSSTILSSKCFDQTAFWEAFGALDIVTDAFIVIFPIYIVSTLQMGLKFKMVVAGVFVTRIAAIAASTSRLVYLSRSRATVLFSPYPFWIFTVCTCIESGLSIITACIPFLKPFFESLETGMLAPSHGLASTFGTTAGGSGNRSKKSQNSNNSFKLSNRGGEGLNVGISVSRRISTHSEDRAGLIKEGGEAWVHQVPSPPNSSKHEV
ncbi:hypothetical protein BU26DRAFT_548538 [Trematosphaeria pertusa]|uniref:Rhodopsin domain-containing protein n=1 Tax=Trematosphaeria pertusa TaxID=390896 RepID=A0A6A6IPK7_9PLEO|nr:uncharacterized protein BU26DRAFT_548538 [Trematosphaeria pertusa]KAF2251732.1 hypothetical protein BU26DRAFT_548538 [Trematosphaeria pertusa]